MALVVGFLGSGLTTVAGVGAQGPSGSISGVPTGTGVFLISGGSPVSAAGPVPLGSSTYVSGVLGTANGGTGLSTVGANGTVLSSNGTSLSWVSAASTSAINQLTQDVLAGPGAGSQAATVVAAQAGGVTFGANSGVNYASLSVVGALGLYLTAGVGVGGASSSTVSGSLTIVTQTSAAATSGTSVGATGPTLSMIAGGGAAGVGTSSAGGRGGEMLIGSGLGGNSTGTATPGAGGPLYIATGAGGTALSTANNANGGPLYLTTGAAGTGGSGTAGQPGVIYFSPGGTEVAQVAAAGVTVSSFNSGAVLSNGSGLLSYGTINLASSTYVSGLLPVTNIAPGSTTGYVLTTTSGGSTVAWAAASSGSSVTGTGLWYSASGTLHSAGVTLSGDLTPSSLSTNNLPVEVTGFYGVPLSAAGSSAGAIYIYSSALTEWTPQVISGDGVISAGGALSVRGLYGNALSNASPSTNQALAWNGSAWAPATITASIFSPGTAGQILQTNATPSATWVTMTGDVSISNAGATKVLAIQNNTVTSGALVKGDLMIATTTSNWAATAVTGDVSFSATTAGSTTVTALQGTPVSASSPSSTNPLVYNGSSWAPSTAFQIGTSAAGVTANTINLLVGGSPAPSSNGLVGGISFGNASTAPSSSAASIGSIYLSGGNLCLYNALATHPTVTLGAIASGSYVVGIQDTGSAPSGGGSGQGLLYSTSGSGNWQDESGNVATFNGSGITFTSSGAVAISSATASSGTFSLSTANGAAGASSSSAASALNLNTGSAQVATSGTSNGNHGGDSTWTLGNGAAGLGGTSNGGRGGNYVCDTGNGGVSVSTGTAGNGGSYTINTGNGGNGTSTGNNGNGGNYIISTGSGGTGGSGNTALAGTIVFQVGGTNTLGMGVNGAGLTPYSASQSLTAGGTITMAASVYGQPLIILTGTTPNATTLVFPNVLGLWLLDLTSATISGTNTLTLKSGSATSNTFTSFTGFGGLLMWVKTSGSNGITLLY